MRIWKKGGLVICEDEQAYPAQREIGKNVIDFKKEDLDLFWRYTDEDIPNENTALIEEDFEVLPNVEKAQDQHGNPIGDMDAVREALRDAEVVYSPIIGVEVNATFYGPPVVIEAPIREDAIIDYIDCPMEIVNVELYDNPGPISSQLVPRDSDWFPIEVTEAIVENAEYFVIPELAKNYNGIDTEDIERKSWREAGHNQRKRSDSEIIPTDLHLREEI
ncbi:MULTISPECIES: hypothetical protein [Haloarcula]|uniref:hypothetical protein n=1 Tax=Haloarcula TaxID=2237 RepID=UPI0023E8C401|nr:hypothetical protein [Halomicroarcula sp. SHR3]